MLAESPATTEWDLAEEQRLASLELAAPRLEGYEVLELIGEGTYGDVWKATDTYTGVIVAIKRLRKQPDAQSCAEVEKLARLGSARGIVALREVHLASEPYCYVMEHLEGGTLADLIRREKRLPYADAWRIFRQLNEALAYVHGDGIVHCDIKPENILLDARGNPRLGDFGQARGRGPGGAALGTRFYMSPEQARLEGIPDPRWDVYALGGVMYEMLTGTKPRFDLEVASLMSSPTGSGSEVRDRLEKYARHLENCPLRPAHRKVKGIDSASVRLVDDCLSLEFADRPQDAAAVLKRIAQCEHARASKPLLIFGGLAPAIMLLAVAVVLILVGTLLFNALEPKFDKIIELNNPVIAEKVGGEVQSLFNHQAAIVNQEARSAELCEVLHSGGGAQESQAGDPSPADQLQAVFERNMSSVYRWSLASATGQLVANYGKMRAPDGTESTGVDKDSNARNYAWRAWFNGVIDRPESPEPRASDLADYRRRKPNRAFVAPPYLRHGKNRFWVIAVSTPVAAGDSAESCGVLSGLMDRDQFFQQMQETVKQRAEADQQIVIVNEQCQVLFHSDGAAWEEHTEKTLIAPQFSKCQHFEEAFGKESGHPIECGVYIDPLTGQRELGAAQVIELESGQRLAVFVQQQNPIRALRSGAYWLAGGLSLLGILFLGTNSYALYWTLRQQRGSSGKSKESSHRRVDQGPTGSSIAPSGSEGHGHG